MHREIIDCYFNIFFVEIQLKKENLKVFLGCQSLGAQTCISFSQTAWICHCEKRWSPKGSIKICEDVSLNVTSTTKLFYHKVPLDLQLIYIFFWRKNNVMFSRYPDFCVFVKFLDFKIYGIVIGMLFTWKLFTFMLISFGS